MVIDLAVLKTFAPTFIGIMIMGALGWKLTLFGVDFFLSKFKKVADSEFVTVDHCVGCQAKQDAQDQLKGTALTETLNSMKREMRDGFSTMNKQYERDFGSLRGVVLAVGMKAGLDAEELRPLTK